MLLPEDCLPALFWFGLLSAARDRHLQEAGQESAVCEERSEELQVTRLDNLDQCACLTSVWDCMTHGTAFRRAGWLHSWWRHYGAGRELYVLAVRNERGQVVGIAPWYLESTVRNGRVVRLLGDGAVCSDHLGVLATSEYRDGVVGALAEWMTQASRGEYGAENRWHTLQMDGVDASDQTVALLAERMLVAGNYVHCQTRFRYWRLQLPESWDAYLDSLTKTRRKVVRRMRRRFFDTGRATVGTFVTADGWDDAMRTLVDLHQRRRQSLGQPGCFADEQFSGFLHEAFQRLRDHGLARLYVMKLDGRPAAAEISLLDGVTMYSYQSGLEPAVLADGPGALMQTAMIIDGIDQRCRTLDFLRGDEPYKALWQAEPFRGLTYRIVARSPAAHLRHHAWVAGDTMKHWIKSGLALTGMA